MRLAAYDSLITSVDRTLDFRGRPFADLFWGTETDAPEMLA
jgi:hypothetical protein